MKAIPLLLAIMGFSCGLQAQSTGAQLATEIKVWGMLKYFHPTVAAGKYDWDTVLLHAIPRIAGAKKLPVINAEVQHLLDLAGKNNEPVLKLYDSMAIMYRNFDTSWISGDMGLTADQQDQLRTIARHPARMQNHYVRTEAINDSVYAAASEPAYTKASFPDVPTRLLALARYWNVIQYYYPYKYLIGTPWPQVLEPLIAAMLDAKDETTYQKALALMVAANNDSQTSISPDTRDAVAGRYHAPFTVTIIDNKAVVTSILDSNAIKGTDIKPGVVIEKVDKDKINDRVAYLNQYIPASSAGARMRDVQPLLLSSDKQDMQLVCYTVEGKKFTAKLKRPDKPVMAPDTMSLHPAGHILENNIGYLRFAQLHAGNMDSLLQSMMRCKAIIFDLREPLEDTTTLYEIPRYLLPDAVPYAFVTAPYFPLPGTFHYQLASHGVDDQHYIGRSNPNFYTGKIVLLVNEHTQGNAEWAAMLLQSSKRAVVIGTPSAGSVGPVTSLLLPDGHQVFFTAQGSYALNGNVIQRKGISLNIPVNIFILDIQSGRDVIMAKALDFINGNP